MLFISCTAQRSDIRSFCVRTESVIFITRKTALFYIFCIEVPTTAELCCE
jgi:hypothetical protein